MCLSSSFQGQTVQYRVQSTDKGSEARDVTLFTGEVPNTPVERRSGTVKRFVEIGIDLRNIKNKDRNVSNSVFRF